MPDDSTVTLAYAVLVVLGIIIVLTAIRLVLILLRKRQPSTSGISDERRVEAEGAIEAVEIMIAKKRSEGYDVSEAQEWLNDAKDLFSKNRFTSCLNSLEAAKVSIEAARKPKVKKVKKEMVTEAPDKAGKTGEKMEGKKREEAEEVKKEDGVEAVKEKKKEGEIKESEEAVVEEVEKMPEEEEMDEATLQKKREQIKKELESIEIPEEEMSTEALIKKKMPKDYLPAKFEIGVAETKIKEAEGAGRNTETAKKHLMDAKAHFEAGRYTEALGLAVKSKKALGVGQEDHIPLEEKREVAEVQGEEEVIEVTVESGENICLNCGNPIKPGDKFCRKCGAKIQVEIYCTKCGTKAEPDDMFCGSCGTKLRK
ncbi:MAG: zinc-ribbon domain-containing protein [Thermoplasmata archaeon]|nr:zinc-ribbon domain-containing protein [Thermoplasmata archaeon]